MQNERIWTSCKIAVGFLIILTLSPIVTPSDIYQPAFMGVPFTLWVGILDVLLLAGLTWLGTRVHPGRKE